MDKNSTWEATMQVLRCGALAAVVLAGIAACSTPPKSERVEPHPLLVKDGGPLLVADVCIRFVTFDDAQSHFVVGEALAGAQALLEESRAYLDDVHVRVQRTLAPFVCGGLFDARNPPQRLADRIDGTVTESKQPFALPVEINSDPEYANALVKVFTFALQSALAPPPGTKSADGRPSSEDAPMLVSPEEFRKAAAVIRLRTGASSALYLGVRGNSLSTARAAALAAGSFVAGMLIAQGSVVRVGTTNYYTIYTPGHEADGRLMGAALIDLESGRLAWSDGVHAGGDPARAEVVAQPEAIRKLLRGAVFRPVQRDAN